MTAPMDPDCQVGKHKACPGWTWFDSDDDYGPCGCPCHTREGSEP